MFLKKKLRKMCETEIREYKQEMIVPEFAHEKEWAGGAIQAYENVLKIINKEK